jgi:hypothetical protein
MCLVCYEAVAAGVAAIAGWRLWLYRVINILRFYEKKIV